MISRYRNMKSRICICTCFIFVLLAFLHEAHGKRDKAKMATDTIVLANRTMKEELYELRHTVDDVKDNLVDMMKDLKGLGRIVRTTQIRIAQLEKRMNIKTENEIERIKKKSDSGVSADEMKGKDESNKSDVPDPPDMGPPKFLNHDVLHKRVTVTTGNNAMFRCPAKGNPLPRIMWLKNNRLFARKHGSVETIKWKITLGEVIARDEGNYTCVLQNKYGTIQHTFMLEIIAPLTTKPTTTSPKRKPTTRKPATRKPSTKKPKRKGKVKATPAPLNLVKNTPKVPMVSGDVKEVKCEAKAAADGNPPRRDCWDLKMYHCVDRSGLYNVTLDGRSHTVFCDMGTDGGGWTVIQRRFNGVVNFNRNWDAYKRGFGRLLDGEFWWGNENIFLFTRDRRMRLRIDMSDGDNTTFVEYDGFWISRESDFYRLNVEGFRGRGGDALLQPSWEEESHNLMMFSTRDRDKDGSLTHCAGHYGGGWWYNDCFAANLNGIYPRKSSKMTPSLQWKPWKGPKRTLTKVEMKFRPALAPSAISWDFWYPETQDSVRFEDFFSVDGECC